MNKAIGCFAAILIAVLAIGAAVVILYVMPLQKYHTASGLLQGRHYQEAIAAFQEMKGYKDSEQKIQEAYYRIGRTELSNNNFTAAEEAFLSAGDYMDSQTQVLECGYRRAQSYLAQQDYVAAAEAFSKLGNYSDSMEQQQTCIYLRGKALMDRNNYASAAEVFSSMNGYLDTETLKNQCWYLEGQRLMERGELENAAEAFAAAGSYENSAELLAQVQAQISNPNDIVIPMPSVPTESTTPAAPTTSTAPTTPATQPQTTAGSSTRFSAVITANASKNSTEHNLAAIAADRATSGSYRVWYHIRVNSTVASHVNLRYTLRYANGTSESATWSGGISTNAFYFFQNISAAKPTGIDLYDGDTGDLIGSLNISL